MDIFSFNDGWNTLNVTEQKVLMYIISNVEVSGCKFQNYKFDILKYIKACGLGPDSGSNYMRIRNTIKKIAGLEWQEKQDNGDMAPCKWISEIKFYHRSGSIDVRLSNDLIPYLKRMKSHMSGSQFEYCFKFKGKYSIRLYKYFCDNCSDVRVNRPCTIEMTLDQLRHISGTHYKKWEDIKRIVLNQAMMDINRYTDMRIQYLPKKKDRRIDSILLVVEDAA